MDQPTFEGITRLFKTLSATKVARPFKDPVETVIAAFPTYTDHIKQPLDLGKIKVWTPPHVVAVARCCLLLLLVVFIDPPPPPPHAVVRVVQAKIGSQVSECTYTSLAEFVADVDLVCSNARTFCPTVGVGPTDGVHAGAIALQQVRGGFPTAGRVAWSIVGGRVSGFGVTGTTHSGVPIRNCTRCCLRSKPRSRWAVKGFR